MVTASSPATARRWLARELRRLRQERGIAQKDAGGACGWSGARLSYLENGQQNVIDDDLDRLLALYEVPEDERDRYYQAARRSHERGWWEPYEHVLSGWGVRYIGLEQGAAEIQTFQPLLVPGLLQTPAYTTAVIQRDVMRRSTREVDLLVRVRTTRQQILARGENPTRLTAVIDEAVLNPAADRQLMAAQLQHLADVAARPNVTLLVLPTDRGPQQIAPSPFSILTFPLGEPELAIVYIEYRNGALFLEEFDDIESHMLAFEGLVELALSRDESLAMLRGKERQNE